MRALAALFTVGLLACNGPVSIGSWAGSPSPSAASQLPAASASAVSASSSALPAPAPLPDYDLADDIALRRELARKHFDPGMMEAAVVGDVFLLVADGNDSILKPSADLARRAIDALYNGRFSKRPTRAVTVYLFNGDRALNAMCHDRFGRDCGSPFGIYVKETREIFANQGYGLTTLVHELVHPMVQEDFPKAPRWLRESIAALFEHPVIDGKEIHGTTNWRLPELRKALDAPGERDLVHLDALFRMPDDVFDGEHALAAYGVARYVCQWLDAPGQDRLWRFYHAWRDHVDDDPTGEKSFAQVVGQSPHDADAAWQEWVRSL